MSIGQRIKTMRIQQDLSIDELACKLGKNRTTIYRYENGDIENLPLGILDSLADALNTTPGYLMGWETQNDRLEEPYETYKAENSRASRWFEEFGDNTFNDEEYEKLIEYGKFLLSMRNE